MSLPLHIQAIHKTLMTSNIPVIAGDRNDKSCLCCSGLFLQIKETFALVKLKLALNSNVIVVLN